MKCPACWSEKAYQRTVKGWKGTFYACTMLVPMKCHHCFHRFTIFRPFSMGKRLQPPKMKMSSVVAPQVHRKPDPQSATRPQSPDHANHRSPKAPARVVKN